MALRDVREQLFGAAERVLLAAGPQALTSRAVTDEAGVAKGVLHRHFADFDQFLTELVLDRIQRLQLTEPVLLSAVGTATITENLTAALDEIFNSVAVAIVSLITFRDDLRARVRAARGAWGIPLLTEAGAIIREYLAAERDLGRLAPGADVDTLAPMLIGSAHLLYADRGARPAEPDALERMVAAALAGATRG